MRPRRRRVPAVVRGTRYSDTSLGAADAAMNGASELAIMKQTGDRSLARDRKYVPDGSLFRDNAATKLGL
jgi:hypothetical protein